MYDNNNGETIKDIEKETNYLKGELENRSQLLSNLRNKNSMCFLQGDAFPRTPTEISNDTPPLCLTIPLNSTNCDESDYFY